MRRSYCQPTACLLAGLLAAAASSAIAHEKGAWKKGYDIRKTGLTPRYPANMRCSPLTSFYASWDDVDGTRRDQPHSGVDGGRLGESILSPASGSVVALWRANWGWGEEQALLLKHTAKEINLKDHPNKVYYSEFDHLNLNEPILLARDDAVARGQRLTSVFRPGGNKEYLPEVHWEVWEADAASQMTWRKNKYGGLYWHINAAHLVDPLYMLSLNDVVHEDLNVDIVSYQANIDYSNFAGFTYILPCHPTPLSQTSSPPSVR